MFGLNSPLGKFFWLSASLGQFEKMWSEFGSSKEVPQPGIVRFTVAAVSSWSTCR